MSAPGLPGNTKSKLNLMHMKKLKRAQESTVPDGADDLWQDHCSSYQGFGNQHHAFVPLKLTALHPCVAPH
jgi:hypothetical protein